MYNVIFGRKRTPAPVAAMLLFALTLLMAVGCHRPADIRTVGGVILVYETAAGADGKPIPIADNFPQLSAAILQRLKTLGVPGVTVEQEGDSRLRIVAAGADAAMTARIKRLLANPGTLELLIVANQKDHADLIAAARQSSEHETTVDNQIGRWVKVRYDPAITPRRYFVCPIGSALRDAKTKAVIELTDDDWSQLTAGGEAARKFWYDHGVEGIEILVALDKDPTWNFSSRHFASVAMTADETGQPGIGFSTTDEGGTVLHTLTTIHAPDPSTEHYRYLGIIYNGELLSAPRLMSPISNRGMITGQFSADEVAEMVAVLRSGTLPIPLAELPVAEELIPAAD